MRVWKVEDMITSEGLEAETGEGLEGGRSDKK